MISHRGYGKFGAQKTSARRTSYDHSAFPNAPRRHGQPDSIPRVVVVSCLHNQLLVLRHSKLDTVKPSGCRSGVGRVTKAVLRAKLFCNLRIDRGKSLLARDFEHAAAGFAGDL